jgi:WD40 repeat protein
MFDSAIKLAQWQTDFTDGEDARQNVAVFSTDGAVLATGGSDGIVRVWRVHKEALARRSGAVVNTKLRNGIHLAVDAATELSGHTKAINDIVFCGNDKARGLLLFLLHLPPFISSSSVCRL